jgi:FKBP-type peptidyl-prolyl cis-trans isomerase FkpA
MPVVIRSRLALALIAAVALLAACADKGGSEASGGGDANCHEEAITTATGLGIEDTTCGEGDEAVTGKTVSVHYVGTLENGDQFDSSRDRGEPFEFMLGSGQVIKGWDEGIQGMRVGGTRTLTIPPDLGYGAAGSPPVIPPDATLIFEVELLAVR